jgi:hypothetical protein
MGLFLIALRKYKYILSPHYCNYREYYNALFNYRYLALFLKYTDCKVEYSNTKNIAIIMNFQTHIMIAEKIKLK